MLIIDRIYENIVVCEDNEGNIVNISKGEILGNFSEGDVLIRKEDFFLVSDDETENRKQKIEILMKELFVDK